MFLEGSNQIVIASVEAVPIEPVEILSGPLYRPTLILVIPETKST